MDFETDQRENVLSKLNDHIDETKKSELSSEERPCVFQLIEKHHKIFGIRLMDRGLTKVKTIRIILNPSLELFKAKGRKYPVDRKDFLVKCINTVCDLIMLLPGIKAPWKVAPSLVSRHFKVKFQIKIVLRLANTVKRANTGHRPTKSLNSSTSEVENVSSHWISAQFFGNVLYFWVFTKPTA